MSLTAGDIMTSPVETVSPEDRVSKVMDRLARAEFNGFPVVDDQNRIEGIITQGDLVKLFRVRDRMVWIPIGVPPFSETLTYAIDLPFDELDLGVDLVKRSRQQVQEIMTTDVETVQVDTPFAEVLSVLAVPDPDINRVPVMDEIEVVGIITRQDVLREIHRQYPDGLPTYQR